MEISAGLVKELREKTGAGMMDCKKALTETSGDFDKAIEFLRKKGLAAASKKSGRTASDGSVVCLTSQDGKTSIMVEINCETDFVARNDGFQGFIKDIANHILTKKPKDVAELMSQAFYKDASKTIAELHTANVAKIGENIVIRRFETYTTNSSGVLASYIHAGGKIGVLIELNCKSAEGSASDAIQALSKDLAMQVAAANPSFVKKEEVSQDFLNKEKEILLAQLKQDPKNANKPENVLEKIIEGKAQKIVNEICLMNQIFVKNPDKTIAQLLSDNAKNAGGELTVKKFVRYQLGEGIAKESEAAGNA